MAGHSQFKNIMYRKGAQDARRAKVFTKLIRELTTAARTGLSHPHAKPRLRAARPGLPDPNSNPRLRAAVTAARVANMPKDTIERAIKRGAGGGEDMNFVEMRYEGFGPGGVAIIVEALTDNRNRTASELRTAFSKHGGSLGESGSVAFMFDRVGRILYAPEAASADAILEAAIEVGAENVESSADGHEITCRPESFSEVRDGLEARFGPAREARLAWRPVTTGPVAQDTEATLLKLLRLLEDS